MNLKDSIETIINDAFTSNRKRGTIFEAIETYVEKKEQMMVIHCATERNRNTLHLKISLNHS